MATHARSSTLRLLAAALALSACSRGVTVSSEAPSPASVGAAQAPPPGVTEAEVRRLLGALAADSMEGRGTGARGSARAARFIAAELQRHGVEPAGDSGYFQRVPIARVAGGRDGRGRLVVLPSLAARDTFPADARVDAVNVVGIIRGSDPRLADEVVLIDAHYDHEGIGEPVNGDSIYNGADDDASGVVAVLEVARTLARGPAPRRTVVFLASTGEEVGLLGTRWYIQNPVRPLARTVANLEFEMLGRPDSLAGGSGRGWLTGYERSTMGEMFAAAGLPIVPDPRPDQRFFERSDNIAFARLGIVAHVISSFNLHSDYHQPSDEVSRVDFPHMTGLVDVAARAARLLADANFPPAWKPGGRPQPPAPRNR